MSEGIKGLKIANRSGSPVKATQGPPPRKLWYLGPGAMPVESTSKRVPKGVTKFAYTGDTKWTPIEADAAAGSVANQA